VAKADERLAGAPLWWEPGTATGYRAITQGYIIIELVQSVLGKRVREFTAEELSQPLDADFQLGVLEKARCRVAEVISPSPIDFSPDFGIDRIPGRALSTPAVKAELAETSEFQEAEMAAGNGFGTAKSMARILSAISLGGTVDGKVLCESYLSDP
jgi:CubicO group peptidase (beta-lactamase class C family)